MHEIPSEDHLDHHLRLTLDTSPAFLWCELFSGDPLSRSSLSQLPLWGRGKVLWNKGKPVEGVFGTLMPSAELACSSSHG